MMIMIVVVVVVVVILDNILMFRVIQIFIKTLRKGTQRKLQNDM